MDILSTALSGITSSRARSLTAANNLANVNTPGYQARQAVTSTGPGGQGTRVDTVQLSQTPPFFRPAEPGLNTGSGLQEGSNVDVAREAINLVNESNITRANVNVVRTADEITRETIDLIG